jgi:replicative DNA helicase
MNDKPLFQLPQAPDAEKALLSSLLQHDALLDEYADLPEDAFYVPQHRKLFSLLRSMRQMNKPVDLVSVTEMLSDMGELEAMGGGYFLVDVQSFVPTAANSDYYASILREKAMRRRIYAETQNLQRLALEENELNSGEILQSVEERFLSLRNSVGGNENALRPFSEGLAAAMASLEATYKARGKCAGLATGLVDFDRMTSGLRPGQLVIVAARPGMGKTCLVMQMARSFSDFGPVAVFSLEMNAEELAARFICSEATVDLQRARDGFLQRQDLMALPGTIGSLAKKPIWVDDTGALSCLEFRSRARRAVVRHGCKAIFVDYLQLMRSTSKRAQESRTLEVAEVSMTLKACAKELNVPVVAACQLNRDADGRNSAPRLADLRESGQIEQDADIVAMLHRPKKDGETAEERERCDCVLAKQRNGPVGTFSMRFLGQYARFENVTAKQYSNNENERQK